MQAIRLTLGLVDLTGQWTHSTGHFTMFTHPSGITVVEQFKDGSFVTMTGPSPGSCDPANTPGTVNGGITGTMQGYFVIPLPPGETQTSFDSHCNGVAMTDAGCDTTTFINTHFSPSCYPALCRVSTFFFHYAAGDQSLVINEWKNASPDRGGNHGDIRANTV